MRNYCIKVYLEDGSYGYYSGVYNGAPQFTSEVDEARLYDTGDEALAAYRKVFGDRVWYFDGLRVVRNSIISVNVNY